MDSQEQIPKNGNPVEQETVLNFLMAQLTYSTGLFNRYLKMAVILALSPPVQSTDADATKDKRALYVHGGFSEYNEACMLSEGGELLAPDLDEKVTFNMSISTVDRAKEKNLRRVIDGVIQDEFKLGGAMGKTFNKTMLVEWAQHWAAFKDAQYNAWNENQYWTHTEGDTVLRGGMRLIDLGQESPRGQFRNAGFQFCSPIQMRTNQYVNEPITDAMLDVGIAAVFAGHTPIGAIPGFWHYPNGFQTVNADLTYAHPSLTNKNAEYELVIKDVTTLVAYSVENGETLINGVVMGHKEDFTANGETQAMTYSMSSNMSKHPEKHAECQYKDHLFAGPKFKADMDHEPNVNSFNVAPH